jgi:hypothetical protein
MKGNASAKMGVSGSGASLEQVCALLVTPSPQALDEAAAILERVAAEVAEASRPARRGAPGQLQEYEGIQRRVRFARILLERAAAYHAGWSAWLGSLTGGYEPGGEAAGRVSRGRLSIEG